jgi:hypothetical protein
VERFVKRTRGKADMRFATVCNRGCKFVAKN